MKTLWSIKRETGSDDNGNRPENGNLFIEHWDSEGYPDAAHHQDINPILCGEPQRRLREMINAPELSESLGRVFMLGVPRVKYLYGWE